MEFRKLQRSGDPKNVLASKTIPIDVGTECNITNVIRPFVRDQSPNTPMDCSYDFRSTRPYWPYSFTIEVANNVVITGRGDKIVNVSLTVRSRIRAICYIALVIVFLGIYLFTARRIR